MKEEAKSDLFAILQQKLNELQISVRKLAKNGEILAEATKNYKIRLRQEALKLKYDGKMPVSLIELTIHGIPEVAELRFKRDVAETTYDTNMEFINATKLQIRIIEGQLDREWNNG